MSTSLAPGASPLGPPLAGPPPHWRLTGTALALPGHSWLAALLSARLRASASASPKAFWLDFLDFGLDFDLAADFDFDSDLISISI